MPLWLVCLVVRVHYQNLNNNTITMKKILLSLLTVLSFTVLINAQMTEGYVKMEITEATSDDEQMAMGLSMLKGAVTEVFFKGDQHVSKTDMMGGMVKMTNLINKKDNTMDMLMDAMGSKIWVNSPLDEAQDQGQEAVKNAKVTYDKADTKEILGHKAYKFMVSIPDIQGMTVTGYATDAIKTDANVIQGMNGLKMDGFPLEFTVVNPQMKMTMQTTEVKESVDTKVFEMNTEGYTKMTMEEFSKSMGGMGMGF